ncbi:MAG TPA: glycosyltransferase [Solirubrobacteraceae bacterium]|nr:glycosyltransferase [Solirubrobacteraceae bacterium]
MSDVLILSLGTTRGLRVADGALRAMIEQAGVSAAISGIRVGATDRLRRGYPVNDIVESIAARRALGTALVRHRPRALIISTTTAALLAGRPPVPFAVWLDSPARLNRPGLRSSALHLLERRQLSRARLTLVHSLPAIAELPQGAARPAVVCAPIPESPLRAGLGEPLVVAYAPDPKAKGLELLSAVAHEMDVQMVLTGIAPERARAFLARRGLTVPRNLELAGMLSQDRFAALLSRARIFLSAARWEDFGQAPLEAIDRGAQLVCAPAGGPFPALAITRALDPDFVASERTPAALARALSAALACDEPRVMAYRSAARAQLAPYRPPAVFARVRDEVLPALLGP